GAGQRDEGPALRPRPDHDRRPAGRNAPPAVGTDRALLPLPAGGERPRPVAGVDEPPRTTRSVQVYALFVTHPSDEEIPVTTTFLAPADSPRARAPQRF